MTHPRRLERKHHRSELGCWEMVLGEPDARLRPWLAGSYCGFLERSALFAWRRELPQPLVPLIFSFGSELRIVEKDGPRRGTRFPKGFVAGLSDAYALSGAGSLECLQVNLTPLGAFRLLGLPMEHLANRVASLEDLWGPVAERLLDALHEARGWDARFELLERFLLARLERSRPGSPAVAWALGELKTTAGGVRVGSLASELGYSHKHLIRLFRREVGLPPKTLARLFRFQRLVAGLGAEPAKPWVEIALDCGYYDQAHLNRDFRDLAGLTPSQFLAGRLPDGGGLAAG